MSQEEIVSLEQTLVELQERLYAKIGRWVVGFIASAIFVSATAAIAWNTSNNRIEKLEAWKSQNEKPTEEYYKFKEELAATLADIRANQRINSASIEKILNRLDRLK